MPVLRLRAAMLSGQRGSVPRCWRHRGGIVAAVAAAKEHGMNRNSWRHSQYDLAYRKAVQLKHLERLTQQHRCDYLEQHSGLLVE